MRGLIKPLLKPFAATDGMCAGLLKNSREHKTTRFSTLRPVGRHPSRRNCSLAYPSTSPRSVFAMIVTLKAVIHDGKVELAEPATLPEGAKVLVTVLPDEGSDFWLDASQKSLAEIWDNPEDDGYAELL